MKNEIKYLCKDFGKYDDCKITITVAEDVYRLMLERGESLPERCENCQKNHRSGKRETRQNYFQQSINFKSKGIAKTGFLAASFTRHNYREKESAATKPDLSKMRIRITDDHIRELYEKLYNNQVVVLASPTGTGKSTYVFYRLLDAPSDYKGNFVKTLIRQGQIIQTQPMTEATARTGATVSTKMLGESAVTQMGIVGIRHHGREDFSRHNIGVEVTDGSLRNWLRDGRFDEYSLIMIDEAHKRSVNIDNLLTLLQYKLPLYPHLKVIIASATINLEEFKKAFERVGISVDVLDLSLTLKDTADYTVHYWKGESIPNCDCWICQNSQARESFWKNKDMPPEEAELPAVVSSLIMEILKNTKSGGILAFLTGRDVIEKTNELLKEKIKKVPALKKVPILPVYSALGEAEVKKRFETLAEKRVLLTTDIAETSHTLEDLVYVIDSGYIKQSQWDPKDMTTTLPTIRHSQYGCRQRFGRVGRTQKGYVYCLYRKNEFEGKFKIQTSPEIFRSPIEETLLTAKAAGISRELNFVGSPEDKITFNAEIERSTAAVKSAGYTDEIENITDDGLDIFHVQLSPQKKALLDLADEQNCFIEMVTFLSLIETKDGNPRTGAEAFNVQNGLLVWDPRWKASTKMKVWKVQEALKAGCADDLDFVLKLAYFYNEAKKRGESQKWAEQNFLNQQAFEDAFKWQEELKDTFFLKAEERQRELDISWTQKLRVILSAVLRDRTVEIMHLNGKRVYQLSQGAYGVVPGACLWDLQDNEKALLVTATKKKNVFLGQEKPISHACALVRIELQKKMEAAKFSDRQLPIGCKIETMNYKGTDYITTILQGPEQINLEYGEELDFAMLMEGYLRPDYKPSISFNEKEIKERFKIFQGKIKAVWQNERKSSQAVVSAWAREEDGSLAAIVVPFDHRETMDRIEKEQSATVTIDMVSYEPHDKKGWILATTREGFDFPLETNDLSLVYLDLVPARMVGKTINIPVKTVTRKGTIVLSNVDNIISELGDMRKKILAGSEVEFESIVDNIDLLRRRITVGVLNSTGTIYSFIIPMRNIPKDLQIGDVLPIAVSLRQGQSFIPCFLEDYEIESLPNDGKWKYDPDSERLYFPYCVNRQTLRALETKEELKEKILRNSWNYAFTAKIINH